MKAVIWKNHPFGPEEDRYLVAVHKEAAPDSDVNESDWEEAEMVVTAIIGLFDDGSSSCTSWNAFDWVCGIYFPSKSAEKVGLLQADVEAAVERAAVAFLAEKEEEEEEAAASSSS